MHFVCEVLEDGVYTELEIYVGPTKGGSKACARELYELDLKW